MPSRLDLARRISEVRQRISLACSRVRRNPSEITLVAVTKTVSPDIIGQAISLGLDTFGENKVQEARTKISQIGEKVNWHMIGHLQTNKVKEAIEFFNLIHSIDSLRLLEELNQRAGKINKKVDILLEVNVSAERSKYGFPEGEILRVIKAMEKYPSLKLHGFMTMAPLSPRAEDSRPYFRRLFNLSQEISGEILPENVEMRYLSMGMTQDFEVAIEEGANMVRVGRAIFGERG